MPANLGVVRSVVDKRQLQGASTQAIATPANYASEASLRARLTAISASTYSTANLNLMTINDMVYALRMNDDAAGI